MVSLTERVFDQCTRGRVNLLRLPEVKPDECAWIEYGSSRPKHMVLRYFFAIDTDPAAPESWTDGAVYLLPPDSFEQTYDAEWISPAPVRPRARLAVTQADFPYAERVFRHRFGESGASFIARLARSGLLGS